MALVLSHSGLQTPHFLWTIADSKKCRWAKRLSCARVEAPVLSVGEAPGVCRGLLALRQNPAYRLTWMLAPPLGPLSGPLPRTSPLDTSLTQSEPLPL